MTKNLYEQVHNSNVRCNIVTRACSVSSQGRSRYRNTYIMLISLEEKLPRQMFKYYYFRPTLQVRLGSVSAPSSKNSPRSDMITVA